MESNNNKDCIPCKVIVVGDSGVGKTSIINRYLNKFNPEEKTTLGASYSSKIQTFGNYKISFDIWDTAGQEKFRSLNSIFYKEAYICLIVYDITNERSFKNIKDYWYYSVKNNSIPEIIFAVAGNKNDLFSEEKVNEKEAKNFCKEINSLFFLTSAFESRSIDEVFKKLAEKFINSEIFHNIKSNYLENDQKISLGISKKKKKGCC